MKNLFYFFVAFALLFLMGCQSSPQTATVKTVANPKKITCTLDKDTRLIEIQPYQQSGCDVMYTKFKTAKSIAKAQTEHGYCREVSQKIVTNLTNSGFLCE
jgi:uncharacterized protein YcfL